MPSALASAAFRGPRLVGFQQAWAAEYLPLARRIAKRYLRHPAQSLPELEAVAAEGLLKAAVRFIPGTGNARSCVYAWVSRELHRHVATQTIGPVTRSGRHTTRAWELRKTQTQLAHQLGREPTLEEAHAALPPPKITTHGRRHPETLDEVAALAAVFIEYRGVEAADHVPTSPLDPPEVVPLPVLPATVRAVVEGATVDELARYCGCEPLLVKQALGRELRRFF